MFGSLIVYTGFVLSALGVLLAALSIRRPGFPRRRALAVFAGGLAVVATGLLLPAPESRVSLIKTGLDSFTPAWQFSEFHTLAVAAPPGTVFDAIERVRAEEITFFQTLIRIRRGGGPPPPEIRNASAHGESLIEVALRTSFVRLASATPRELVVGTVVGAPSGWRGPLTPDVFLKPMPAGFALATMNFLVTPDGGSGSVVSTETRVYANSPSARRRFAAYWRIIYPGSALIRRMWLRAIERRATGAGTPHESADRE